MAGDELTTATSWDHIWEGGTRRRFSGLHSKLPSQVAWVNLLRRILDVPGRNSAVLELGCAPGTMIGQMHELRPDHEYGGIDISRSGLDIARARLTAKGIQADLLYGDMRDAVVALADLVVSFGLIEHFASPTQAMQDHLRFVKPGGYVAVTVPNYSHPVVVRAMKWFSPETLATHNLEVMSTLALRKALSEAGFVGIKVGECGGPTLPNSRPRPDLLGKAYRLASQGWNVGTAAFPEKWPWSACLWAVGQARV